MNFLFIDLNTVVPALITMLVPTLGYLFYKIRNFNKKMFTFAIYSSMIFAALFSAMTIFPSVLTFLASLGEPMYSVFVASIGALSLFLTNNIKSSKNYLTTKEMIIVGVLVLAVELIATQFPIPVMSLI